MTVQSQLEILRHEYGTRLPERLVELETRLATAIQDVSTLPDVRAYVHRLRGTAGTYGYVALSHTLRTLEELLEVIPHDAIWHERVAVVLAAVKSAAVP